MPSWPLSQSIMLFVSLKLAYGPDMLAMALKEDKEQ